jgi:hypothetical protein
MLPISSYLESLRPSCSVVFSSEAETAFGFTAGLYCMVILPVSHPSVLPAIFPFSQRGFNGCSSPLLRYVLVVMVGPLLPQVNSFVTKEHPPCFQKSLVKVSYIWLPSHSLHASHNVFFTVMPAVVGAGAVIRLSPNGSVGGDEEGPHLVVDEV